MSATLCAFKDVVVLPPDVPSTLLFLDTNIVLSLHVYEVQRARGTARNGNAQAPQANRMASEADSHSAAEVKRGVAVVDFLYRAKCAGAQLFTTPMVLEEVFHTYAGRALRKSCTAKQCVDHKELRRKHPDEFDGSVKKALAMLAKALDAVSKQGIGIKWYVGNDTANKLGTKIKDAFLALLEKTPQLDGNDAMHVVTARLMECVMFASTDGDFRFVSDVIVFCENPLSDVR